MRHVHRRATALCALVLALVIAPQPVWAADDGSIEIGVTIAPSSPDGLVATGVDPAGAFWLAGILVAIGVAALTAGTVSPRVRAGRPGSPRS